MSTTNPSPARSPMTLDISGTPRVGFTTLIRTELRKSYNTRAGLWLLLGIALITLAIIVIFTFAADSDERTIGNYFFVTGAPQGFVLPVLGILLVTSEWGQRTTLTTFTLEPSRMRVIWAKVVAALILGVVAIVLAIALAALATVLFGGDDRWEDGGLRLFANIGVIQLQGILLGVAFGLVLLNSAAAIVLNFVLPLAVTIVANLVSALSDSKAWFDISTAQEPLFGDGTLTSTQVQQLVVTSIIWIVLPFVAGLVRVSRAEVK